MIFLINNKNIFVKLSLLCITVIIVVSSVILKLDILPFDLFFLLSFLFGFLFLSIWFIFDRVQSVLSFNEPLAISGDTFYSKVVSFGMTLLESSAKKDLEISTQIKINIDERIECFVNDLERLFIKKWYNGYISDDETFLHETRNLLDIIVRRFLQISAQINSDKIVHRALIVLLKHVREFRRTVKKVKKVGGSVEKHYRYAHVGSKSRNSLEHFTHQISSKLLRHFVNWELYNSLASRCVVSILAKKLVTYSLVHVSAPGFINYKIVEASASEEQKKLITLENYAFISILDVDHMENVFESVLNEKILENNKITICTPKKRSNGDAVDGNIVKRNELQVEGFVEEDKVERRGSTTPVAGKLLSEPVKIHESKSSNKTWRNSSDLDCISLGQDILYLSDVTESNLHNVMEKKLWNNHSESTTVKKNVMETFELFGLNHSEHEINVSGISNFLKPATTGAATLITNTIKPIGNATAHTVKDTMKDIQQSTVNVMKPMSQATCNAMHKIGDLQDEAAGVVEGIFDFGMAGLKKGLRLTGLQENVHESAQRGKPVSDKRDIPKNGKLKLTKLGHVNSDEIKFDEVKKEQNLEESVWVNPLGTSSPSFEGDILLEKSPLGDSRSLSSDSTKTSDIPTMEISHIIDSPDPEYEDTTDLATTTAKLRCLLAQRTSESSLSTPAASPMSLVPTPIDPSGSSLEELSEVDGTLPSMYKAWAKTATGVFQNTLNTIKTVLPGNANDEGQFKTCAEILKYISLLDIEKRNWIFVQADAQPEDLSLHMEKFLSERRVFCTIDNAYEAIEAMDLADQFDSSFLLNQGLVDDELDDFDTTIPLTKAFVDLICELLEDTYPSMIKESIVKVILLTMGRATEEKLHKSGEDVIKSLNGLLGALPKFQTQQAVTSMKIDEMVQMVSNIIPALLLNVLSEDAVKSIFKLLLQSLQSHKINQDTNLQLLELFACEIMAAASQSSPTYSA